MDSIWSALITTRDFTLLDRNLTDTDFWEQEVPKTLNGRVDIDEHEIKVELGKKTIRIYHIDGYVTIALDKGITQEILLGEIKNGNNQSK